MAKRLSSCDATEAARDILFDLHHPNITFGLTGIKGYGKVDRKAQDGIAVFAQVCQKKYKELLELIGNMISLPIIHDLIDDIKKFNGPLEKIRDDSYIKLKAKNLSKIIS